MGRADCWKYSSPTRYHAEYSRPRSNDKSRRFLQKNWPLASRLSRSLKVLGTDTCRLATYDFLLVIRSRHGPISYRFGLYLTGLIFQKYSRLDCPPPPKEDLCFSFTSLYTFSNRLLSLRFCYECPSRLCCIIIRADDVVRRRGYCDHFVLCIWVCGCVRVYNKTKAPDRNDLKLDILVVLDTMSKGVDFGLKGQRSGA